jgi:hypothetical protein
MKNQAPVPVAVAGRAGRIAVVAISSGAALASILNFAHSWGIVGNEPSHLAVGSLGAATIHILPSTDTAESIGDTLQLAALVKDKGGSALIGTSIRWSSDDPSVATVASDGSVVARGPGETKIVAVVGDIPARARVVVRQRVVRVRVAEDSTLVVDEGAHVGVRAVPLDARGHAIPGRPLQWATGDSTVAWVDSADVVTAGLPGQATLSATVDGVTGHAPVTVRAIPASMSIAAGTGQRAAAGSVLAQPITVRVLSRRDRPIVGSPVRFRAADGTADPAVVFTDEQGRARSTWTLGPLPGRQRLVVDVDHIDSSTTVVAEAEPVPANTRIAAIEEGQDAVVGASLKEPVGVRLTDTTGRPLVDVPVAWVALDEGTVTALAARTDSLGEARAAWTLGPKSGTQRVRVQIGGARTVPPVTLRATALAGGPATLAVASGGGQRGRVGRALERSVVLKVMDAAGNPVPGVEMTLEPSAGSIPDSSVVTDSTGRVLARWTLGRAPGEHRLVAKAAGLPRPVEVTAAATVGAAANVSFVDPPSTGATGRALPGTLVVEVSDEFGNPVADATVSFTARSGRVSPARVVTDAKGVAKTKWVLGTKSGEQTLVVSVKGTDASSRLVVVASSGAATSAAVKPAPKKESATRRP